MARQTSNSGQRPPHTQGSQNTASKPAAQSASNRPNVQPPGKRPATRAAQRSAKQQQREQELLHARRARRITLFSILGAIVVGAAVIAFVINNESHATVNPSYPAIDSISCDTQEQVAYHIHAHLSIYINGTKSAVPQSVGIASDGSCFYWLHTHDTTGVIHIESPTQKDYSLGNFFDVWEQRFSSSGYPAELASQSGWQVWIDGKPYSGDFRAIPLTAHKLITMAYNSPGVKPDTSYAWNGL
jgi:hypothetical protein